MSLRPQHKHPGELLKRRDSGLFPRILTRVILGGLSKSAFWTHTHCDYGLELDEGTKEPVYLDYSCRGYVCRPAFHGSGGRVVGIFCSIFWLMFISCSCLKLEFFNTFPLKLRSLDHTKGFSPRPELGGGCPFHRPVLSRFP